jgi:hypothetical protein
MKSFEFVTLALSIVVTYSMSSQTLAPEQSRQIQFIWDQSSTAFDGQSKVVLDSIFRAEAHQGNDLVLGLTHRTEPLPLDWTVLAEAADESTLNILASQSFVHPGELTILVPKSTNPTTWYSASWSLIVDGVETSLTLDEPVQISVPHNSESTSIGVRVEHQGSVYERHLLLPIFGQEDCPEPDDPPWPISNQSDPYWVGVFDNGTPVTGQALVRMGSDQVFDRPMIILEGFDPNLQGTNPEYGFGDMNWDVLWDCDGEANSSFTGLSAMLDSVLQEGFDLVFLDYQTGTHSIYRQSKLLQHVIELCRDARVGSEPLVVIGPSMGGVVARHTLSVMEHEGFPHCVRLFISIDSPFRGAHLPLAFQQSIEFFSTISADAASLEEALSSPAAGELLVASPFHPDEIRELMEANQNELGLPKIPINMSIVNSNPTVPFTPPSIWYQAVDAFLWWDLVDITLWSQPGNASHAQSTENDWVTLDATLTNPNWEWGEPIQYESIAWNPSGGMNLESLPGSYSVHLSQFEEALSQAGIEADSWTDQSMFIPCHSALDIPLAEPFDALTIPFDFWQTENAAVGSAYHCSVENHFSLIWDAIVNGQPTGLAESSVLPDTIQIGWKQPFNQFLTGHDSDSIGHIEIGTTAANGPGTWPHFQASNSPCSDNLVVPTETTMLIGDSTGSGHAIFTLAANSTLEIQGDLHIGAHSSLVIEQDARLVLHNGRIHVHAFGEIEQKQDGKIEIQGSSQIALNGSTAKWKMAGDLILYGPDSLLISSEIAGSTGIWEWTSPQVYTFIGTHGNVTFEGNDSGFGDIVLDSNAGHLFDGPGEISFANSTLHFQGNSHLNLSAQADFNDVLCAGIGQGNQITTSNRISWHNGTLENCAILSTAGTIAAFQLHHVEAINSLLDFDSTGVRLNHCSFIDCSVRTHALAANSFIKHCEFDGGQPALPQLEMQPSLASLLLESNEFKNHSVGISCQGTELEASCNVWFDLEVGLDLKNASLLNASPPNGQNRWYSNEIHVRCNQALVPNFINGWNLMEDAGDALFLGSLSLTGLTENTNAPYLIAQNQNFWPAALQSVPMVIPYTELFAFGTENPVVFKDASPYFESCSALPPMPHDSDVKKNPIADLTEDSPMRWRVFPNPVSDGKINIVLMNKLSESDIDLKLFTSNGQCVHSSKLSMTSSAEWSIDVSQLEQGIYHLELRGLQNTLLNQSKIVILH